MDQLFPTTVDEPSSADVDWLADLAAKSSLLDRAAGPGPQYSPSYYGIGNGVPLTNFGVNQGWTDQRTLPRFIGDVNGDGKLDFIGIGYGGIYVSIFDPNRGFGQPALVSPSSSPSNFGVTQIGDANGDGRSDLVSFRTDGTSISYGQADGTFDVTQVNQNRLAIADFGVNQGWRSQDETPRVVGDINGDGKADIVGFGTAGVWVALGTGGQGSAAFGPIKFGIADWGLDQGWSSDQIYHRMLADVNGDGKADIVGFGNEGVSVSLSNGDGTFAPMIFALDNFGNDQGWDLQNKFPRLTGDLNHDGRADIVGFGAGTTYVAYGQADGTFSGFYEEQSEYFTSSVGWNDDNLLHHVVASNGDIFGFGYDGIFGVHNWYGQPLPG